MKKLYSIEESFIISKNMKKYGGGFVSALGEALAKADPINKDKLAKAFPGYFKSYYNFKK